MFYHVQELKYSVYDKIYPCPLDQVDKDLLLAYQWLGKHCGYCPQIWLARGKSHITGYNSVTKKKKSRFFGTRRNFEPNLMFSFDIIKGFPVDYDTWCSLLHDLIWYGDKYKNGDDRIRKGMEENFKFFKEECKGEELPHDDPLYRWMHSKNLEDYLNKYLFVENDQVIVPSLNLKVAKEIFCRSEKQVKALRRMGFIKDRIKILNSKQWI